MSNKHEEYVERIRSIMPAPGWTVWACYINDDDTADFEEIPVVGWAVAGYERRAADADDNLVEHREDEVKLLIKDAGDPVQILNEALCANSKREAIEPNGWNEERMAQLEKNTRYVIRMCQGLEA